MIFFKIPKATLKWWRFNFAFFLFKELTHGCVWNAIRELDKNHSLQCLNVKYSYCISALIYLRKKITAKYKVIEQIKNI